MIIDVHAHLGVDVVFDSEVDEDTLLETYRNNNVDGAIVQPYVPRIYIEDHQEIHNRIHRLTLNKEKKFWGMASINPHFRPEDYDREAYRCIKELGFVGIKITPIGHAVHPSSKDALHVWEVCKKLETPVMIHTGAGIPFADPMSIEPALELFPDVTCVIAHGGTNMYKQQAIYLAKKFENVYIEPSWVGVDGIQKMLKTLGSSKILFSSDIYQNVPVELAKYRSVVHNNSDLDNIFYKNAARIYKLKV